MKTRRRLSWENLRLLVLLLSLVCFRSPGRGQSPSLGSPPYPPSPAIQGLAWHWETLATAAPGSDLWPVAWGPDGYLYAAWGDGGGFSGSNSDGRVAMGFARIEGGPEHWRGTNVNGGKNPEHPASFPQHGKTTGIAFVDGVLFATINLQDGAWPNVNHVLAWSTDSWMTQAKYGLFLHYQHRILLGYCIRTKPQFPQPAEMTAAQWNQFVEGFEVRGFAAQMAEARVGWVIFCLDDHYFAWPCAPNQAFSKYTGYAPGEKCSRRDLIRDLADALNARGVKLICYYAGLNGYMKDRQTYEGLKDDGNAKTAPSAESRKRRLEVLQEYCERYQDTIAGWWFDGMEFDSYSEKPNDWPALEAIVRRPNPSAVIALSAGDNEFARIRPGLDNFTGGDTWVFLRQACVTGFHLRR